MNVYEGIAHRLKLAREAAQLSQRDVGIALNMSGVNYGDMERERIQVSIEHLFAIAPILGVSVAWLLGLPTDLTAEQDHLLALYGNAPPEKQGEILAVVQALVRGV